MKSQHRTEPQPRRMPMPELLTDVADKGRKHEAFESGSSLLFGCDRRSLARAMRFDRKR